MASASTEGLQEFLPKHTPSLCQCFWKDDVFYIDGDELPSIRRVNCSNHFTSSRVGSSLVENASKPVFLTLDSKCRNKPQEYCCLVILGKMWPVRDSFSRDSCICWDWMSSSIFWKPHHSTWAAMSGHTGFAMHSSRASLTRALMWVWNGLR